MDVTCQSCRATYKVDDAKIPANGIKAKCPKCGYSFLLKKPDEDVIAIAGDTAPPAAPDPFAGFGAAPVPDLGGGAPPPDPFAAATSAPAPADPFAMGGGAPAADPFAGGFGGSAPAPDPFANGFGGGGFGSGGFDSAPAPAANNDSIGGLFQAKTAFEIKRANGEQIGPFDLFTIKQMIYEQGLDGTETLLDATGNWVPITQVEDLGEIFRLTGAQAADGGSSQWGGAQEAKPVGWQKMEQPAPVAPAPAAPEPAAPAPVKGRTPAAAPVKAPPPPAPVALDGGRRRGLGERVIILTEGIWSLTKTRGVRIAIGVVIALAVLGVLGFQFRWSLAQLVGLAGPIEAARLVTEGDRTIASGERGPMLTALARYAQALEKDPDSADAQARSAEVASGIWFRDPPRLDMKAMAETNIGKAAAEGETLAVLRAQARFALAKRDFPAAEAALAKAAALPAEGATDPILAVIRGDVLFEKGDMAGAAAAYTQAKSTPSTAAHGSLGLARVKLRAGEFDAAKTELATALTAEPDNGTGKAVSAYLSTRTGGDVPAARKALREIAASPHRFGAERAQASYFLGVLSEEAGLPSPALHHMADAVRHNPSDPDSLAAAKRLFQARFPTGGADAWLARVSKVRGSTAMDKVQTGQIEFEKRSWQSALSPLIAATQEDPGSAHAQYALGRLLVEVSESEKVKAKGHFERAIAADPDWAEPVIALARWELDAKNVKDAQALGAKAVQLDPTMPDAYRIAASSALAAKDYAAAEQSLQFAVEFDPEDYLSWLDLGEARRLGGRAQDAIPAVETAASLRPELAEPLVRLGAVYEALNDLTKASEYFTAAAKIEPANLVIATRAGVLAGRQGLYAEARKRLEAVVKEQRSNAEALYWLGIAHQYLGDPEKAVEAYRDAIKYEYFDKYLAHWHLGEVLGGPGAARDADAAREQLKQCLLLKPEHFQCLEEQAKIARSENQFDEAIALLKKVESSIAKLPPDEKNPVIIRVVLQQGRIAKGQGKLRQAEGHFKRVLKGDKQNAEAMWNLGQLAMESDPRIAKNWYLKAINAKPAYAPPYRDLGYLLKDENNVCGAKTRFEKFVELSMVPEEKKLIQDELALLDCAK